MKPRRNQVFCIGCKHQKMLFESKSKADNFIKFNSEEIETQTGKAPTRSYYCSFCGGWHVTSIAEEGKGIDRDKRDEELWEKIKVSNKSYEIGTLKLQGQNLGLNADNKRSKFPKNQNGVVLKVLAEKTDRIIAEIESALCRADVSMICYRFEELKEVENELRSKSKEFEIDVKALDKRYEKIENIRSRFLYLYDYLTDEEKRRTHLESLNDEEKMQDDNIIILNIEVINSIQKMLNEIDPYNLDSDAKQRYKNYCETILNEKIPLLKGPTKSLKNMLRHKTLRFLSFL